MLLGEKGPHERRAKDGQPSLKRYSTAIGSSDVTRNLS